MSNNYESPQTTEHLHLPQAECNHINNCNDCKKVLGILYFTIFILFIFIIWESMIINQVLKYEQKHNVQVYERNFKLEHLKGPIK